MLHTQHDQLPPVVLHHSVIQQSPHVGFLGNHPNVRAVSEHIQGGGGGQSGGAYNFGFLQSSCLWRWPGDTFPSRRPPTVAFFLLRSGDYVRILSLNPKQSIITGPAVPLKSEQVTRIFLI